MVRIYRTLRYCLVLACLTVPELSTGKDLTGAIGDTFREEETHSMLYQYGWLGIYSASAIGATVRAGDADTWQYRESHTMLGVRSLFGVYKFIAEPLLSHGARDRYQEIMADAALSANQKKAKVYSMNRQVALDQEKKGSLRGLVIGTVIHTLVAGRIYHITEDRYFAGRAFLSGMTAQILSMLTLPDDSLNLYRGHPEQLQVSFDPGVMDGSFRLGLAYRFH